MAPILYPLVPLLLSVAIMLAGSGLMSTLLALRMEAEQFPTSTIGMVLGCYSVGFVLASLTFHKIIIRIGHIRAFALLAGLAAGSTLLYPLLLSPLAWALLRALFGFCIAGLYMIAESWLNERSPRGHRGAVLAVYSVTVCAAFGGGSLLLNLWDLRGFELFSLAAVLLALSLVPISLTRTVSPVMVDTKPVSLKRLYAISPLGCVGAAMAGLMSGAFSGMGPVFARQVGLSVGEVTIFVAASMIGGLLLQWPLGRLSDRVGRRPTIVGVSLAVAALSGAMVLLGGLSEWGLVGLATLWGGLAFALYPLCLALSNDFIAPEELVGTGAGLLLVNGIGMAAGPVLASGLMEWNGPQMLFVGLTLAALVLGWFGAWRHRVGTPLPLEAQNDFVLVAKTTPLATALDPRAEDPQLELPFGAEAANEAEHEPAASWPGGQAAPAQ
jgi:MFS family permease